MSLQESIDRFAADLVNLQSAGCCKGVRALAEANKRIAEARGTTPEGLRSLFRSYIKWAGGNTYLWGWILKG